jgi:preprotein translocase subunit SecE
MLLPHSTSGLQRSLSSHMIKDRDHTWAILLSQVTWPSKENAPMLIHGEHQHPRATLLSQVTWPSEESVCPMLIHGEHQCPGPFSLAKSHGHRRRMFVRCICTSSLHRSLSSHMIKDKDYAWAILLSQVTWPSEKNVPFSLAKSHGHLRRMSATLLSQVTWPSEESVSPILPSGEASTPRVFVGPCQVT